MNERESNFVDVPEVVVQTKKTFSVIWVVPIVAALIGGWLAYKALSEKGPNITITFKNAEGLEAGKTKIKYKDVEIGRVETISLSEDLTHISVKAALVKEAEKWLSEDTRFWVVRARMTAGKVSGIGTIFSGAYIAVDPGKKGKPAREFEGLDIPPVVTTDLPGRHFLLKAGRLGSLDIGSPVYFRQITVGKVVAHELDKNGQNVNIKIFIHAPHHELVHKNTRFWNASGFDVSVDASGIKVNTESIMTILIGGIAFDTPFSLEPGILAKESSVFVLYESREKSLQRTYLKKSQWLLYFDSSVRGLNVGAPVEFKGIKIGEVTSINLEFDWDDMDFRAPVFIEIEPERLEMVGEETMERSKALDILCEKGLRAQLKSGNILTGQLYVDLDIYPNAPPRKVVHRDTFLEFPTIPTPLEEIASDVTSIVDKLEKLPLAEIGDDLRHAMQRLSTTTSHLDKLIQDVDKEVAPAARATLERTQKTLNKVDRLLNAESPMGHEMKQALEELAKTARSVRSLSDYLERHPEALIKGKGKNK